MAAPDTKHSQVHCGFSGRDELNGLIEFFRRHRMTVEKLRFNESLESMMNSIRESVQHFCA